jgi:hypothetical protein
MEDIGVRGYLDIAKEEDRLVVASVLFKHGYTVSPKRVKKDGKSYKYLVYYEKKSMDRLEGDVEL